MGGTHVRWGKRPFRQRWTLRGFPGVGGWIVSDQTGCYSWVLRVREEGMLPYNLASGSAADFGAARHRATAVVREVVCGYRAMVQGASTVDDPVHRMRSPQLFRRTR